MKPIKSLCIVLTLLSCQLMAQEQTPQEQAPLKNVLKISPQHFFINTLKVGLEHFASPTKSYSLYVSGRTGKSNNYTQNLSGIMAEAHLKKYLKPFEKIVSKKNRSYYQSVYLSGFFQGGYFSGEATGYTYILDGTSGQYDYYAWTSKQDVWNGAGGFTIGLQQVF